MLYDASLDIVIRSFVRSLVSRHSLIFVTSHLAKHVPVSKILNQWMQNR